VKASALADRSHRSDVRLLKVQERSVTLPPRLHLKGAWLETLAGFRPGGIARVSLLAKGFLVIEQLP
jgi:hypothetical protein